MYNLLTNATKKRVIKELRQILYDHPRYRADSQNVQNKYSFEERPNRGIIINSTSADRVRLSADNYIGRLSSFVMLAPIENKFGTSIEWVRENFPSLEEISPKRDVFPSAPGVYVVNIISNPDDGHSVPGQFTIDPILTVSNEPLILFQTTGDQEAQISRENIYQNSVRLWLDNRIQLIRHVDYEVDESTGSVTFLKQTTPGQTVHADYRYVTSQLGPFPFQKDEFNVNAIPGVVIAFGDRCQEGDSQAIVISDERTEVAEIYGGKFEVNFELLAFVFNDAEDRERLSDYIIHQFLNIQNRLGYEGIELLDISPSGENEEIYNSEEDTYYYDSSISLSLRVDWETWLPLPVVVSRIETSSRQTEQSHGWLDGTITNDLLQSTINGNVPTIIGKELSYERIK